MKNNNDNTTKAKPVESSTVKTDIICSDEGEIIKGFYLELTKFTNKEYVRIRVNFPNGSYEDLYVSNNRSIPKGK